MTRKILAAATAVCALALLTATAHAGDRTTIAMRLVPSTAPVACSTDEFGLAFDVRSLGGRSLGTGQSCIRSIEGCDPMVPFCRQTVLTTFTLDLARGSLTAPMKLHELWPTASSFLQKGSGTVRAGTGAYASASGHIDGGGAGAFDEAFDFTGRLVYVAELRGVR
jgi:hypothetical protein